MDLDNIDNTELLTTDEIEERIANARIEIINIYREIGILTTSSGIFDEDYGIKIKELNNDIRRVKTNFKAYQTALNADPSDYD